jgi:hypothetical protein
MSKPSFLLALLLGVIVMTLKIVLLYRKNDTHQNSNS